MSMYQFVVQLSDVEQKIPPNSDHAAFSTFTNVLGQLLPQTALHTDSVPKYEVWQNK